MAALEHVEKLRSPSKGGPGWGKNFHACCDCMKERCLLSKVAAMQQSARILLKRT